MESIKKVGFEYSLLLSGKVELPTTSNFYGHKLFNLPERTETKTQCGSWGESVGISRSYKRAKQNRLLLYKSWKEKGRANPYPSSLSLSLPSSLVPR